MAAKTKKKKKQPQRRLAAAKDSSAATDLYLVAKLGGGGLAVAVLLSLIMFALEEDPSPLRWGCRTALVALAFAAVVGAIVVAIPPVRLELARRAAAQAAQSAALAAQQRAEALAASKARVAAANAKARHKALSLQRARRKADAARYLARAEEEEALAAALRTEMEAREAEVRTAKEQRQWVIDRARIERRRAAASRAAAAWREGASRDSAPTEAKAKKQARSAAGQQSDRKSKQVRRKMRRLKRRRDREREREEAHAAEAPQSLLDAVDASASGGTRASASASDSSSDDGASDDESRGEHMALNFFATRLDVVSSSSGKWERIAAVRLVSTRLHRIGTLQTDVLSLALRCDKCGCRDATATLSGTWLDRSHFALRCPGRSGGGGKEAACGEVLRGVLRPSLVHAGSDSNELGSVIAVVETRRCAVVEVLLERSRLLAMCESCDEGVHFGDAPDAVAGGGVPPPGSKASAGSGKQLRRGVRSEASCRGCHHKLAFEARSVALTLLSGSAVVSTSSGLGGGSGGRASSKAAWAKQRRQLGIVEGTALPKQGACRHYKQSLKWLRYGCCGRAYPCPICHAEGAAETCAAAASGAAVRANRMICGACSHEQPILDGCAQCGFLFGKKKGAVRANRTDGNGGGMSQRRSVAKTQSNKSKRVGAAAAKIRDKKKAGRAKVTVK